MKKGRIMLVLFLALFCTTIFPLHVQADDPDEDQEEQEIQDRILDEIGLGDIERFLHTDDSGADLDFSELLTVLLAGDYGTCVKLVNAGVKNALFSDVESFRKGYLYVILLAMMAAIFSNISSVFEDRQISETGFFILYLAMVTVMLKTFQICSGSLQESLDSLLEFMKLLNASFCLSIGLSNGSQTAAGVYGILLIVLWLVETVFVRLLMPLIYFYLAVMVLNFLSSEPFLNRLGDLVKKLVSWSIRTVVAAVTGINLIQRLTGPAIDSLKRTAAGRTAEAVPVIGDVISGTGEVISGTAVLIRNGLGVAGMIVCLLICLMPMLRFCLFLLLYRLAGAVLEPVTDKRITEVLTKAGDAYGMLLHLIFGSVVLFLISIAVICTTLG
jgi:stage III sporulation protein AE